LLVGGFNHEKWRFNQFNHEKWNLLLVGGFNHLEKYEFVNGKDYPIYPYMKWKITNLCNHQPVWISIVPLKDRCDQEAVPFSFEGISSFAAVLVTV